jgi:hypothetical protein
MRGWKAKLVFLLIVYFTGFATAIYCLAPAPEVQPGEESSAHSAAKSNQFAQSFNVGMHKCLDFAKDATLRVSSFIKQKLDERQADS